MGPLTTLAFVLIIGTWERFPRGKQIGNYVGMSLLADLKERRLDVALVSFKPRDSGFESKFITQDELVLITSPKHPLAAKRSVHVQYLGHEAAADYKESDPAVVTGISAERYANEIGEVRSLVAEGLHRF